MILYISGESRVVNALFLHSQCSQNHWEFGNRSNAVYGRLNGTTSLCVFWEF